MTKIETLLACLPESPFKEQLKEEIAELTRQRKELLTLVNSFRDDVVFRVGSTSPYRQVVQCFQDRIAAIKESKP